MSGHNNTEYQQNREQIKKCPYNKLRSAYKYLKEKSIKNVNNPKKIIFGFSI